MNSLTIDALIDRLGGTTAAAKRLGLDHSTVSNWRRAGTVSPAQLLPLHDATGIPVADLRHLVRSTSQAPSAA